MASPGFRLEVHFAGRVQGVGFRYTTRQIAQGFEVTGHVRNLPDGQVEVIAEGAQAEVAAFVAEIQSELVHYIKETTQRAIEGPAQFQDFHIG